MHSDGQGRGVLSFYQFLCSPAIYKGPFSTPTGDGGRYAPDDYS